MDDLQLSLQPKGKPEHQLKNESLSLAQIIPRITQERGSFAHLSEEDLLEEVEGSKNKMDIDCDDEDHDRGEVNNNPSVIENDNNDVELQENGISEQEEHEVEKQNFDESRRQLMDLVGSALNESALSLDFVSLLLSCLRPAAGTTSMSPLLKEHVAVGSLSADALTVSIPEENPRVGAGWKLESLGKASDLLKNAAGRLKEEANKENTYWKSIYNTVSSGEVLFKIRKGDTRGLGIKYGFGDAGSEYRDKGTAMIKRKRDGEMSFKFDMRKRRHVMRVTLLDNSNSGEQVQIGCSSYRNTLEKETSVLAEIKNARRLIFEEELFYEIVREARRLAAYKVQVINGKVVVNLQDHVLEIDHVDPMLEQQEQEQQEEQLGGEEDDGRAAEGNNDLDEHDGQGMHSVEADLICNAFRLLLCDTHRQNLEKRRSEPAPLNTKQPEQKKLPNILRPVMMHIHHAKVLRRTSRLLDMILQNHEGWDMSLDKYSKPSENISGDSRLGRLLQQPLSTYTLEGPGVTVTIDAASPIHPQTPLFKAIASENSGSKAIISTSSLYELGELEEWVNWILNKKKS